MSGLHNRYPRYFYKRGNLFNTYLGYTEPSPQPAGAEGFEKRRKRALRTSPPVAPKSAQEQLVEFVQWNLSAAEAGRLFHRLAAHKRVPHAGSAGSTPWQKLPGLIREHLDTQEAERYLAELKRRKQAGEQLVGAWPRKGRTRRA